ncbi:hypothetical protein E8E13_007590 [Curvularia kusanoi]|uniref:Integral membrane protein n=1 Tax=Curvularia kusanoi TaxID=90978 RepID=A0A9P4TF10_CURKU|nr:hypothetical protein E8E13_007590 [Curvularia kusanoi]
MGKAGRVACIITPMALTVASLICLLLVMVGQLSNNNKAPSTSLGADLYFFKASSKADTSNFTADEQTILDKVKGGADKFKINSDLLDALTGAASSKELKDFYQVGLWSYCEGEKDKDGVEKITYCSSSKTQFWFNPIEVWGLQNTSVQNVLGDDLQKGLDTYKKVAGWMNWAFIIATILTAAEFVIGFFAIFSRWGSLVTTILSTASSLFSIAAAATATGVYGVLTGVFHTALEPYNIEASMGNKMLQTMWLGVAFSIASGLFWLLSVCCCSGSSGHKKTVVEKTPYSYERVASPAFGQSGHQLQTAPAFKQGQAGTAYEPYRGQV